MRATVTRRPAVFADLRNGDTFTTPHADFLLMKTGPRQAVALDEGEHYDTEPDQHVKPVLVRITSLE